MTQTPNFTDAEQKAIPSLCILAAMADGAQSELERHEIKRLVNRFSEDGLDLKEAYQDTLAGRASMQKLAGQLESNEAKQLAYEMAVCICGVDNALNESEKQFLANLHRALELDITSSRQFEDSAAPFSAASAQPSAEPPILTAIPSTSMSTPPPLLDSDIDQIILNRAILAGALEIMPQNLATMAIIPVQMQLVYQLGKRHGFDLSLSHTKEFLATIGVGMTSQVVESYLTKFLRGATKRFAGKFVTGLVTQATESAIAFATTYAIGHAANKYYASGRTLSMPQLQEVFTQMLDQGRTLKTQYGTHISQRSSQLSAADLLSMVRKV